MVDVNTIRKYNIKKIRKYFQSEMNVLDLVNTGNNAHMSVKLMTKMAVCAAFCCVTAWLSFPLPFTPGLVTALTLALGLTAYVLTPKQTFMVILVYLLLGAAGLPVFPVGTGGIGRLIGPTGGFYFSWLLAYPLLSLLKGKEISFKRYAFVNILVCVPIVYIGGLISMMLVMEVGLQEAFLMAVLPFIPGDIMKALISAFLGVRVNQHDFQ